MQAFPKPKDMPRRKEWLVVYPDGREVLDLTMRAGKLEYGNRLRIAYLRQGRICSICRKYLRFPEATVDHFKPKKMGGSEHDDRQQNLRAAHLYCNTEKGSKRIGELHATGN